MELKKEVVDESRNLLLLEVSGRIKSAYLSRVETELGSILKKSPVLLILDLTGIESIDSSGIGVLIEAKRGILHRGGNVVLMAGARVQSVIKLSGLENYFKLAGTKEEAIELVKQPPEPLEVPETPEPPETSETPE